MGLLASQPWRIHRLRVYTQNPSSHHNVALEMHVSNRRSINGNDDKTINDVTSLRSKHGISVYYQGKNRELVHKGFTKFVEAVLKQYSFNKFVNPL